MFNKMWLNYLFSKKLQTKEKHEESVAFAAFSQWCDDTSAEKTNLIEAAKVSMMELDAVIAKSQADAESLSNSIAGLDATIADLNTQLAGAKVSDVTKVVQVFAYACASRVYVMCCENRSLADICFV